MGAETQALKPDASAVTICSSRQQSPLGSACSEGISWPAEGRPSMFSHFVVLIQSAIHIALCQCQESPQKRPCADQAALHCRPGQMPAATSSLPWKRLICSPACLKQTRSCTACGSCTVFCQRSVDPRHRQPTACRPGLLHRCSSTSARYAMRNCQCHNLEKCCCMMQEAAKAVCWKMATISAVQGWSELAAGGAMTV